MTETLKSTRALELFETLRRRIIRWEYLPGHRFTEEDLCREFGVSRSPVRETLRLLEEHGLVDKVPYRGCTVKQPDVREVNELYDVRIILEQATVEQLATHAPNHPALAPLAESWRQLALVTEFAEVAYLDLPNHDRAFHETLAAAAGNRTLCDMLRAINDRLHFMRMTDITDVVRLRDTCQQHLAILQAIAQGDPAAARAAMRQNIEGARQHVERAVRDAIARAYLGNRS